MIGQKGFNAAGFVLWILVFIMAFGVMQFFPDSSIYEKMGQEAREWFNILFVSVIIFSLMMWLKSTGERG